MYCHLLFMFALILWSQSHECAFSIPIVKSINCSKLKTDLDFYISYINGNTFIIIFCFRMLLSIYASVTNIVPNLDDQSKISGCIQQFTCLMIKEFKILQC